MLSWANTDVVRSERALRVSSSYAVGTGAWP